MNSSLNSRLIASISGINLSYEITHYTNQSARDLFINLTTSPFKTLRTKEEYFHVLKDINFNIFHNDKIGLLGINGAGKTSLCRCIAGMISPHTGKITMHGKTRAIFDTGVGILPELTGRENAEVISALLYPEMSPNEKSSMLLDALEFSELGDFLDVPFLKYSKGMQARLSLSIISAKGCDLLILDEVYDVADIFFQEKVSKRVLQMINNSGAVIFVSHSPEQIEKICNRVIILDDARIVFDGNVNDGLNIYRTQSEI
jgi:ABC-type polysaccharide/polyol phosphate transport system ATPase subunit